MSPTSVRCDADPNQAVDFATRLNRHYRRLATGMCFLTFMLSGLFVAVVIIPLLRLLPGANRRERPLALVRRGFGQFMRYMCGWRVIRSFEVEGLEHLEGEGPFLCLGNHPSLIDVVAVMSVVPNCNCVIKKSLYHHPFMGGVVRGAGFLLNEAGPAYVETIAAELARGRNLVMFPEGTRSPGDGLNPFNRGAAHIALRAEAKIVPVLVSMTPRTLMKGQPWYDVPNRPVDFKLRFLPPLEIPQDVLDQRNMPLRVRALTRYLESFFNEQLGHDQPTESDPSVPAS